MSDENTSTSDKEHPSRKPNHGTSAYWNLLAKYASLLITVRQPSIFGLGLALRNLSPFRRAERKKTLEEQKMVLVKQLVEAAIDPATFDVLLANETDRRLKVRFGITFLVLTFLFTSASYAIVILDGVLGWGISQGAITALIIETPIQFIGLLYIIARNLFPQGRTGHRLLEEKQDATEQPPERDK